MSCCGNKRQQMQSVPSAGRVYSSHSMPQSVDPKRNEIRYSEAYFEYKGTRSMMIIGPHTGKQYRFNKQGDVVAVDLKDRVALQGVRDLRETFHPFVR